jgi:flagellar biosynthesis protein
LIVKRKEIQRAAALQYRPAVDRAPRVVAKGERKVAEKILAMARKHHIRVHQDPDLLEALSGLDLLQEIPEELYVVVAELFSFLYSLNRKKILE